MQTMFSIRIGRRTIRIGESQLAGGVAVALGLLSIAALGGI